MKLKISLFLFVISLLISDLVFGQYCNTNLYGSQPSTNYISNVTIVGTTLNNLSMIATNSVSIYPPTGNYTAVLQQGLTYSLSVTSVASSTISVWLDYNQNFVFDPTEWIQVSTASLPNVASLVNFTIPFSATGNVTFRIRSRDDGLQNAAGDACATGWLSGEAEQYTITIANAPPCTTPPAAGTTVCTKSSVCSTTQFTLSLQGAAIAQGLSQQWQSSADGINWSNISGATATFLTKLQAVPSYYRCVVSCSGVSSFSTSLFLPMYSPQYFNFSTSPFYYEGFENWIDACDLHDVPSNNWLNTPASGNESWRRQDEGYLYGGWTLPNISFAMQARTGTGAASFHSSSGSGLPGVLDFYFDASSCTQFDMNFWYFKNQAGFDKFEVYLSTDAGLTFGPPLLTIQNNVAAGFGPVWVNKSISNLPCQNSATCILRFKDFGDMLISNETGIDDFSLFPCGLGIGDKEEVKQHYSIYPNPSNGQVEIRFDAVDEKLLGLQLLDFSGKEVYTSQILKAAPYSQKIDWSNQPKGIYLVKLISESNVFAQKIILE
jgi:hypothetical protein